MKELNFDNKYSQEDDRLIPILKEALSQEPSQQFAETTLREFLNRSTTQNTVHQPLKLPVYIMAAMVVMVITAVIIGSGTGINLPSGKLAWEPLFDKVNLPLDSWYLLAVMLLVLFLFSILWTELGKQRGRKPAI